MLEELQRRVLAVARARVACGRWTISGLARKAGISQPQLANALSGARHLSIYLTDQLAMALKLDLTAMALEAPAPPCPILYGQPTPWDTPAGTETAACQPAAPPRAPLASYRTR